MVPTLAVEKLDWGSVDFEHLVEDLQLNVAFLVSIILLFQQILSKNRHNLKKNHDFSSKFAYQSNSDNDTL